MNANHLNSESKHFSTKVLRKALLSLCAAIVLAAGSHQAAAQEGKSVYDYEGKIEKTPAIGTKWTYQHIGLRSAGNIGLPMNGDRTREIIALREIDGNKLWESRETWGNDDADPVRYLYDEEGRVHQIEQGAEIETISPPLAFDFVDMKAGDVRELESIGKMSEGDLRFQIKATRLLDETIEVPAGIFKNCQKVQIVVTCYHPRFNNIPFQLIYMCWYHPKANGMVKESFKGNPPVSGGEWKEPITGVSLLKSYQTDEGATHAKF